MIHIDVTPAALAALDHIDLRWQKWLLSEHFLPWNFRQNKRTMLFLHEGTHLKYTRDCGFEPELYGPTIDYDPERGVVRLIHAGVEGLPGEISMNADPVLVAKSIIGPVYAQEKLLGGVSGEEIRKWTRMDLRNLNNWYVHRQQVKGDVQGLTEDAVRDSVLKDLRSPAFRKKLWDAAREFEARVFGGKQVPSEVECVLNHGQALF